MHFIRSLIAGTLLAFASPVAAEVGNVSPNGFVSTHKVALPGVSADHAYERFLRLPQWWDPAHSYSGKSASLRLDARAGGCWCEQLEDGGSVEHMRVLLVQPGKRLVMSGGLGPLMYQGVAATMDVAFAPTPSGTTVTITYRVAGFPAGDAEPLAAPVDAVLAAAAARYGAYARARVTKT